MWFLKFVIVLQCIGYSQCETIDILTSSDQVCPGEFPCKTLQQYVANPSTSSEVILQMQSGNHSLSSELSVSSIVNFTINGNSTQVICTASSAQISLTSVDNVLITGVAFVGCGRNTLSSNGDTVEIRNVLFYQNSLNSVESVNSLIIKDSEFNRNVDGALHLIGNVNFAIIEGTLFIDNEFSAIDAISADSETVVEINSCTFLRNTNRRTGGCIRIQSSTVTISVSNFTDCNALSGFDGGAIYGERSTFTISNTNFTGNQGLGGGAISSSYSHLNITSCNFIGNVATQNGGGIKGSTQTKSLTLANTNFISNIASTGGGVYTERLSSLMSCNFMNNTAMSNGGGLSVQTIRSLTLSYSNFIDNSNTENGGGVFITVRSVVDSIAVDVTGCSFVNNIAGNGRGGGIYFKSNGQFASMVIEESSFRNNTATTQLESNRIILSGGGVYLSGGNSSIFIHQSDFSKNTASGNGGGLYVSGSVVINSSNFTNNSALLGEGGAIQTSSQSTNMMFNNSIFDYNTAPSCGVLDINDPFHTIDIRQCSYNYNSASGTEIGGGVLCVSSVVLTVINSNMNHNTANLNGGVFYINDGVVEIRETNFLDNSATGFGGVIYTYLHKVSYHIFDSTFSGNAAGGDGGAIFIGRRGSSMEIKDSNFSYNSAESRGGVISIIGSDVTFNDTSSNNNVANKGNIVSACNSIVSVYSNNELVQRHISNNICSYFDDLDSAGVDEAINITSDSGQISCSDCDMFLILTSLDHHCPGEFTGEPCLTLQQYVSSPSYSNNISLILEPGNHTLTGELITINAHNFTMIGSDARVICMTTAAQITLTSIQHVLITGVAYVRCRRNTLSSNGDTVEIRSVLFYQNSLNSVESVNSLIIKDSEFNRNVDGALHLIGNVNFAIIEGTLFIDNEFSAIDAISADSETVVEINSCTFLRNTNRRTGGCILVHSSTVTISVSNFTDCKALGGFDGGAIYGERATLTITNTNFTGNQGWGGGAISSSYSYLNITSCNFIGNVAQQWGGGIKGSTQTKSLTLANTNFISNIANSGGGVHTDFLTSLTCCNFMNNTAMSNGGGIWVQTIRSLTLSYSNFIDNSNTENGGGVFITVRSIVDSIAVDVTGCSFVNNIAGNGRGGGIYFMSNGQFASMVIEDSSFINNTATTHLEINRETIHGGGVYLSGVNGSISVHQSFFTMNSALANGGAVYITGSIFINESIVSNNIALTGEGGAISLNSDHDSARLTVSETTFINNESPICGAVSVQSSNQTIILIDSTFTFNKATTPDVSGGGVSCFRSAAISIAACNFLHNSANYQGGVFFIQHSSFTIENSLFFNNSASQDGGVLYTSTPYPISSSINHSTFGQNSAGNDGGVLFIENSGNQLSISESTFSENTASNRGGAIRIGGSTVLFRETNIYNNSAFQGNSISACSSTVTFLDLNTSVVTNSSDSLCQFYEEDINEFFDIIPHNTDIMTVINTTSILMVTCPFEYNTPMDGNSVIAETTTAINTFVSTTEPVTTNAPTEGRPTIVLTSTTDTTTESNTTVSMTETTAQEFVTTRESEATNTTTPGNDTMASVSTVTTTELISTTADAPPRSQLAVSGTVIGTILAIILLIISLLIASIVSGYCLYYHRRAKYNLNTAFVSDEEADLTTGLRNETFVESEMVHHDGSVEISDCHTKDDIVNPTRITPKEMECHDDKAEFMNCPVCKDIQVDPCTLQCGHTVCQLCLARMWKDNTLFCPICKSPWKIFPAISIDYRDSIEHIYPDQVAQLRNEYKPEDKELIKEFVSGKCTQATESVQEAIISDQGDIEELKQVPFYEAVYKTPTTHNADLQITKHPLSNMHIKYQHDVNLSVSAVGTEPIKYKWKRNGADITHTRCAGTATSTLTIACFSRELEGDYTCTLFNDMASLESEPAKLMLDLQIIKEPLVSPSVKFGEYVILSVSAVGIPPITYKWKKDGADITLPNCTASDTRILTIHSCDLEHQGSYSCTVNNNQGCIESKSVELKIVMEFTSSMTDDAFYTWLKLKQLPIEDQQVLKLQRITASVFKAMNTEIINKLNLTLGGRIKVEQLLNELELEGPGVTSTIPAADVPACPLPHYSQRRPSLHEVYMVEGKGKSIRVIDKVAYKWDEFAMMLHFEDDDIKRIQRECRGHDDSTRQASRQVITEWKNGTGRQPATWATLIKALNEAKLSETAEELKFILED